MRWKKRRRRKGEKIKIEIRKRREGEKKEIRRKVIACIIVSSIYRRVTR